MKITTTLAAPAETVWAHATSFAGINAELWPVVRMSVPPLLRDRDIADIGDAEPPVALGRSWLLVLGVLPIDYDDIGIAAFEPPRRFHERSTMLAARGWEHERTVEPSGHGCRITDEVRFVPRFTPAGAVLRVVVPRLFAHRHNRLVARFGRGTGT